MALSATNVDPLISDNTGGQKDLIRAEFTNAINAAQSYIEQKNSKFKQKTIKFTQPIQLSAAPIQLWRFDHENLQLLD